MPALVTVNWYGIVVPAVITAGKGGRTERSTCFSSWRLSSGSTVLTLTWRIRCTSVEPPVDADRPNLYVEGMPGGATMSSSCTHGSATTLGLYRISTMMWAGLPGRLGVTPTLISRSDGARVVARRGCASVVPGLFGFETGLGTVESSQQ